MVRWRWGLAAALVGVVAVAGAVWAVIADPEAEQNDILSDEKLEELREGGWREAVKPLATLPVDPNTSAQAVAARIAQEYCGEPEVREVTHSNEVPNDTRFFVPACVPVTRDGTTRLDIPYATISVTPGELPVVRVEGGDSCNVNVGARYDGFGLCVTNLLKGQ